MIYVGSLPLGTNATLQRQVFSLGVIYAGVLPYAPQLVVRNDSGAAFASSGNDVHTLDASGDLT